MSIITSIAMQLAKNGEGSLMRNQWYRDEHMDLYVRYSAYHLVPGVGYVVTLDISNVNVNEGSIGKGVFTRFLDDIERTIDGHFGAGYSGIFVENVLQERFQSFFERRGYVKIKQDQYVKDWPSSYFRARKE